LLRGEDLHKALGKGIKNIGLGKMQMERCGVKLGKDINLSEIGINAI
jgi:hypothetical protein